MTDRLFTPDDLEQLDAVGISEEEARRQIALLVDPPAPVVLDRAATVDDGIRQLDPADHGRLLRRADEARQEGRMIKFVPASGAASRMFAGPLQVLSEVDEQTRLEDLEAGESATRRRVADLLRGLPRLALYGEVGDRLRLRGLDPEQPDLPARPVLELLLGDGGLAYAARPKALVAFHEAPEGPRTPFDEHLVEAASYVRDRDGICRVHFTVSSEHRQAFEERLGESSQAIPRLSRLELRVGFSSQSASTDTLALDDQGRPFRDAGGRLALRPGGHGALLGNLGGLRGDLVFIKTIDNVLPDSRKADTLHWKNLLAGLLVEVQETVFEALRKLDQAAPEAATEAAVVAREVLGLSPPGDLEGVELAYWLRRRLHRPLRICGMVRNEGEPGGGPFWVQGSDGQTSLQIVEASQISPAAEQRRILAGATHFNPVDLVCGLRDHNGRPYELERFVDPATAFVAQKSFEGRPLRALERPGLWNGAMAGWNTLFVEVPSTTFAPVKTALDLLRPEHLA